MEILIEKECFMPVAKGAEMAVKNIKTTKCSYISNSYQESLKFIDTGFFTASISVIDGKLVRQ